MWRLSIRYGILTLTAAMTLSSARAQPERETDPLAQDLFRQLDPVLPTPNGFRLASGSPGADYVRQTADYRIEVELDPESHRITGHEVITYTNNFREPLDYLWLQVDANMLSPRSLALGTRSYPFRELTARELNEQLVRRSFDGSVGSPQVQLSDGEGGWTPAKTVLVGTMLRVTLQKELNRGCSVDLKVEWSYEINDATVLPERTGYERLPDGNYLYAVAQWFPRMAAYTDTTGWQHKQFLGAGEFALEFGEYEVAITVPADYVVAATGELQNAEDVLTQEQRQRLDDARAADRPMFVITEEEARANGAQNPEQESKKTWTFHTKSEVRDFAFAACRKFMWDGQGVPVGDQRILAMSLYPPEAEGPDKFWSTYSTRAVAHALQVYSDRTFPYPYSHATSVNAPIFGMEYPMVCFNGPRPTGANGEYTRSDKTALVSVVIHEVGHNWFPMIVNSDERQWTWMDEGLTTFLQFQSEQEWDDTQVPGVRLPIAKGEYPSDRGVPKLIIPYMLAAQAPIMTASDSVPAGRLGANAYGKPAAALTVLRTVVMGPDLFDDAFRRYARRWRFRHPMPADFFRTMEDASAVDLDWFWRGWFYTTDHVDLSIDDWQEFRLRPELLAEARATISADPRVEARDQPQVVKPELGRLEAQRMEEQAFDRQAVESLEHRVRDFLRRDSLEPGADQTEGGNPLYYYLVKIRNVGGLVSPLLCKIYFEDGSQQTETISAQIWRRDQAEVVPLFVNAKRIISIELDPEEQTADANRDNNVFPRRPGTTQSRFEQFEARQPKELPGLPPHKQVR